MANLVRNNSHSDLTNVEESANKNPTEGSSLESTSAESESASSCITKVEVTTTLSSEPKAVEDTHNNEITVSFEIAKGNAEDCGNQSSSSVSTSSRNIYYTDEIDHNRRIGVRQEPQNVDIQGGFENFEGAEGEEDYDEEKEEVEESYEDDDTISSEAVVDDIELILMPESVENIPPLDLSPQLVRVTELRRSADYEADVFRDDDGDTDQESDFKKMGSDEEDENGRAHRIKHERHLLSSAGDDYEEEEPSSSQDPVVRICGGVRSMGKVNSGVQTDITALDNSASILYEFRRKSSGKSSSKLLTGKRLNWKSELTLLPSKTKIRATGLTGYESMNYQDQYSPRALSTKFTSQDTLSSSAQFLKPSTLYRTRNLSRNLNQCVSSESTLGLSMTGLASTESPRYRERMTSSTSAANFKADAAGMHSYSAYQISSSMNRRQPVTSGRNFRSSLPDLSSSSKAYTDNKKTKSMKYHKSYKLQKKSSSEDDTSSLIDESERCLRSSIDLLLTDDLPCPGDDLICRSNIFGSSGITGHGHYSSRRSCSQPILTDDGDYDIRDSTMGSPFLPRKLSDMRCSRWAKVILPNGQVTVVAVKEMDELRDSFLCTTDTGCVLSLPFRKVVFAWKIKR